MDSVWQENYYVLQEAYDELQAKYDAVVSERDELLNSYPSTVGTETTAKLEAITVPKPDTTVIPEATKAPQITNVPETEKAEILFRNIPWGSSSTEATSILKENTDCRTSLWKEMFMDSPKHLFVRNFYEGVSNGGNILYVYDLTAGGFDVDCDMYFSYSINNGKIDRSSDELYAVVYDFEVTDYKTVYSSLKDTLSSLYGKGELSTSSRTVWKIAQDFSGDVKYQIQEITWEGTNNTFLTLRLTTCLEEAASVQQECGVQIAYGKSDADEQLKKVSDAIKAEKAEQDKNNAESGGNDGL